jgi:hypothetical protein
VFRADETLTHLMFEVDGAMEEDREAGRPAQLVLKKLAHALEEFGTFIDDNASGIVNYGERIATGFVESTINQLVAKRFVKEKIADEMDTTRCASSIADPTAARCAQPRLQGRRGERRPIPHVPLRILIRLRELHRPTE